MDIPRIKTPAQFAEIIARLTQAGEAHHLPLYRAAMRDELRFAFVQPRGQRLPLRLLDMTRDRRPFVVILADDGMNPAGPDGYPQARRLLQWAAYIVVHACGGEAWQYQAIAEAARACGRVVVVETDTAHQAAWLALKERMAPRTGGMALVVRPGAPAHPMMTAPAGTVFQ